jgi:hypothetical protein
MANETLQFAKCGTHTILLIISTILIVAFTDDLFKFAPVLSKLFTNPINFILLVALVICVLFIDLPSGIILTFLALYLAVSIRRMQNNIRDKFDNIVMTSQLVSNNIIPKFLSESEFLYKHDKPIPNGNIPPFQPLDQVQIEQKTSAITPSICNPQDQITVVGPKDRAGFDTTGCRYDMKNSPQNLTQYGPPLSACGTYDNKQTAKCGTVFYPLNG